MPQVTFERRQRPPPIRLGLSVDSSVPKYVRTPYPTQPFSQVVAGVPSPSISNPSVDIDGEERERERKREKGREKESRRIYYLAQGLPKTDLSDEISDFFHEKYPLATFHLHCSSSLLALDEQWELCLPHPLLHSNPHSHSHSYSYSHNNGNGNEHDHDHPEQQTKLVQAHHIYIQFIADSSPQVPEWPSIAKHIRDNLLSKHEMSDAAIELASASSSSLSSSGGEYGGHVSAWYPPKLDKEKLRTFFEGAYCCNFDHDDDDGEDSASNFKLDSGLDMDLDLDLFVEGREDGEGRVIQGEEGRCRFVVEA